MSALAQAHTEIKEIWHLPWSTFFLPIASLLQSMEQHSAYSRAVEAIILKHINFKFFTAASLDTQLY